MIAGDMERQQRKEETGGRGGTNVSSVVSDGRWDIGTGRTSGCEEEAMR